MTTSPKLVKVIASTMDGVVPGRTYPVLSWAGGLPCVQAGQWERELNPKECQWQAVQPESGSEARASLLEAADIVAGARNKIHGHKERSFDGIARFWNAYLDARQDRAEPLGPRDVALMLMLMKVGRALHGKAVRDHFVDMAGYAAIAGEVGGD